MSPYLYFTLPDLCPDVSPLVKFPHFFRPHSKSPCLLKSIPVGLYLSVGLFAARISSSYYSSSHPFPTPLVLKTNHLYPSVLGHSHELSIRHIWKNDLVTHLGLGKPQRVTWKYTHYGMKSTT